MKREALFNASRENIQWFQENYERLKEEYDNKWIIVHDQRVVESKETFERILPAVREYDANRILVEYVQSKEIAMFF